MAMFDYNNLKYVSLKAHLDLVKSESYKQRSLVFLTKYPDTFRDLNFICISGLRQTGKTTAMKKLFNPAKDIYISWKSDTAKDFLNHSFNQQEIIFEFDEDDKAIINERKCLFGTKVEIESILNRIEDGNVVIYIDLETYCLPSFPKYREYVDKFVAALIKKYKDNPSELVNKIIVYT